MKNLNDYEKKATQQAYSPLYISDAYKAGHRKKDPTHYINREIMQVITRFVEAHKIMPAKLIVSRPIYDYYGDEIETFGLEYEVLKPEQMGPETYMIRLEGYKKVK